MRFFNQFTLFFSLVLFCIGLLSVAVSESKSPKKGIKKAHNWNNKKGLSEEQWVLMQLKNLSLEDKIAQSFMVACWSNKGNEHLAEIEEQITKDKIGGVIFFQGERENLKQAIEQFQQKATLPLLIGMDAEWGIAMRIANEKRFPYAQTIGAANDLALTEKIGQFMGQECYDLGIHINFAPVADVNSNPKNPVIGFRAFGTDPGLVSKHVAATVKGMESAHILSCIKHFPGHGDTDKDSHLELPTVSHTEEQFKSNDFLPFQSGISAKTNAIMVAHLQVPALDNSGTPSSLSEKVIQGYLRNQLGYKGLVISDALNMKAVADKFGKTEVVVKAYAAGCDVLLFPESVTEAIALIKKKVLAGELDENTVNERCKNVLRAKFKAIINKPQIKRKDTSKERELTVNQVFEKAMVVLKNEDNALPIDNLDQKIVRISIGTNTYAFRESIDRYAPIEHLHFFTIEEALTRLKGKEFTKFTTILVDFHASSQRPKDNYGFGDWKKVIDILPLDKKVITTFFGNSMVLENQTMISDKIDGLLLANENHEAAQDRAGQFIFGAFDIVGKLPFDINETFKKGAGIDVKGNGRLKYTIPEELGIPSSKMEEIDAIVNTAIQNKTFPGCQVVVAIKGKVIHQKSYGTTVYEKGDSITNNHLYDIASITKIASSTMSLMKLKSENKFDVTSNLGELVPELVKGTPYAKLIARDMLTHQAGLTPWIPFYKKTLQDGELKTSIYSKEKKDGFSTPVADGIWIQDSYWKTMLDAILNTPLSSEKKYEYSDLGYYFFKAFIERVSGQTQDQFVQNEIYRPLGLQRMTYLPFKKFKLNEIVPTENDKTFRKQVVQGYVHDPGAAMVGGVGGHAGLFSTAIDLAALMQVVLNKGQIGSFSLIKPAVIEQFTSCQFCPQNRRGLGFDKPTVDKKGGPTCPLVSSQSFGHSGFTGTLAWADPEFGVNYVFLSNRVYPDADNWKITNSGVRTEIQRVIYEAIQLRN